MKRLLFLLLNLLIASCAKEAVEIIPAQPFERRDHSITLSDIKAYIAECKGVVGTKADKVSILPYTVERDTLMYLVNYEEGWELLSADRRAPRVFAMSEKGHMDMGDFMDCPGMKALFDNFAANVSVLRQSPDMEVTTDYQDNWNDVLPDRSLDTWQLVSITVLPEIVSVQTHLTQTRWGQGFPWNVRAPFSDSSLTTRCYTGCGPVAAAQVLYYLHQTIGVPVNAYQESSTTAYVPGGSYLVLQPSDVQFDASTYSSTTWENMPLTNSSQNSYSGVSTLMLQQGLYIGADYHPNGTFANADNIVSAFQVNYSISSTGTWNVDFDIIAEQIISENQPVILTISFYDNNNVRQGHIVVVDACKEHYVRIIKEYRRPIPVPYYLPGPEYEYKYEVIEEMTRYVGINWGWNGNYMTSDGEPVWFSTDAISWNVGYVFTQLDYMIYGFHAQ